MVSRRACKGISKGGDRCSAPPLLDGDFCFWHDPEHVEVVAQARSAGGQRRKREATLATAYHFQGLTSIDEIRRLVEVAAFDALGLENSINRIRALGYLAQVATTLLEKGEMDERLNAVEAALGPRLIAVRRR